MYRNKKTTSIVLFFLTAYAISWMSFLKKKERMTEGKWCCHLQLVDDSTRWWTETTALCSNSGNWLTVCLFFFGGGWLMILLLLQGTQQILLCLSVATWIIEKVVSSITVLFVYTYIFGNKITILFKDVENSIPSYKTSIPFIIPYLHLAFFLSLALSLLPCHPSSWR